MKTSPNPLPRAACALIALLWLSACAGAAPDDVRATATVYGAASLADALEMLADRFERETGARIRLNVAASSTLARQIEAGAPAELFISANQAWMDHLAARGLIDLASRRDLLANRLVLIAAPGVALEINPSPDAPPPAWPGRLALGDPDHVPAGQYAAQALGRLGWRDSLTGLLLPTRDVRAALYLTARGEAPLAIVYASDAAAEPKVRVLAELPASLHEPIRYPMALTPDAGPTARRFHRFLFGPEATAVFHELGFEPIADRGAGAL